MSKSITLYGIANCDTVKRARQALDTAGIAYRFHDFKREGLEPALAQSWLDTLGEATLINRRGTTWRKLSESQQARTSSDAASLLAEHPSLVKRPVIDADGQLRVGFAAKQVQERLDWLQA